jgi:RNA polymerase sigma-70 factor, ECF subfamily
VVTDGELVAHIVETGDPAAFGELVRRHEHRIRSLLRRLSGGDAARADDLAQDTFVLAFRRLASFRGESALATWLARIAVRQHLSDQRRSRPELVASAERAAPPTLALAERVGLERGLAQLRPEQRTVVVLTYGQGFTHEEVADMTGWPLGTVKTHALRGRAALRALLEGDHDDG